MSQHVERKKTCALHSHGDYCTVCVFKELCQMYWFSALKYVLHSNPYNTLLTFIS